MIARSGDRPSLLLVTTTWWPSIAVLASALEEQGCVVVVLCPHGHVAFAAQRFTCRALDVHRPEASIIAAIEQVGPDLVVPGDERVVAKLVGMHAAHSHLRNLLERSLGSPGSHTLLLARAPLLEAASSVGFTVPETRVLHAAADLESWIARVPPPWVLKADGAWGGEGVRISSDARTCRRQFRALRRGVPPGLALRRKLINGDPFLWQSSRARRSPSITAQAFVAGRPANCSAFALRGRLLGATVVEAETTCGASGPSTLVRALDRPDILGHVERLIAQNGLSGFLGFDFVLDRQGRAALIEMNPRITTPCRFDGPFGPSPVVAAASALAGRLPCSASTAKRLQFASFPLAWLVDPFASHLAACAADVPWREPGIVRESLRPLWPERGSLAHLPSRLRLAKTWCLGRSRTDHRQHPFAWWLAQQCLGPPPSACPDAAPTPAWWARRDREACHVDGSAGV